MHIVYRILHSDSPTPFTHIMFTSHNLQCHHIQHTIVRIGGGGGDLVANGCNPNGAQINTHVDCYDLL